MPDEFRIPIVTTADLAGANASDAAFARLLQSAEAVAQASVQAAAQVQAADAAAAEAAAELHMAAKAAGEQIRGIIDADKAAADAHAKSMAQAAKELEEADHAASHFLETLKQGVGIDIGHRLVEGIAEIPRAFQEAVAEGVKFNAEMETLTVGLAGAFRSASPERFLNFAEARAAGTEAMDAIRAKANALGLDFHALAEGLSINMHGLAEGGIQDVSQQIDLITTLNQAAQAKGLQGNQASRDILDLLNGRANRTLFGAELGIKDEDVKNAREAGKLYEFLNDKLAAYKEGGQAAADTFAASEQRLKNETEQLYGEITKPVFDEVKEAYNALAEEIKKPEVDDALKNLGYDVAGVVELGGGLVRFAVDNAGVLVPLGTAIGGVTFALGLYKTAQIASIIGERLTTIVAETDAIAKQAATIGDATKAVEENTIARKTNSGVGGGIGLNGGTIGGGLVAAASGYAIGRVLRARNDKEQDDDREKTGTDLDSDVGKVLSTRREIENAATVEDQIKRRADLTNLLTDAQSRLKKSEDDIQATKEGAPDGFVFVSPEALQRVENLKGTIQSIKVVIDQINRVSPEVAAGIAASRAAGELSDKNDAAQEKYDVSPEARRAKAEQAGDQTGIDDAEYDAKVDKLRPKLEKEFGFTQDASEQKAQEIVSADEDHKEEEKDRKESERIAKKAQEEADAWTAQDEKETAADAKAAADQQRLHDDTIAAQNEDLAILQAKAKGQDDLADKLTKEKADRAEITRLMKEGLNYQEALDNVTQQRAAKDAIDSKKDPYTVDPQGKRSDESGNAYLARTGRIDAHATDSDDPEGLTTGGLGDTGGLVTGGLGPRNQGAVSSASAALAGAPSSVPDPFLDHPYFGYNQASLLAGLTPGDPLSSSPTAASGFSVATAGLGAQGGGASAQGGDGTSDALTSFGSSTKQAGSSVDALTSKLLPSVQTAAQSLDTLSQKLQGIGNLADSIDTLTKRVSILEGTLSNLNAGG